MVAARRTHAVRVHQRGVRVRRRCRSRSAPPRSGPAPTPRPRARACCTWRRPLYNASGLGLPIVMTVANRAIGAPINIWNDHSDSMSQRDSGWIQLYVESNQEAIDTHILAFRLAEELSLPVMVCMDGFILTHAYERVDLPTPGAGGRVPAAVRAAPGAGPGRAGDDRRDGRAGGLHGGEVPGARQADAGARVHPAAGGRARRGARPRARRPRQRDYRLEDADTIVVALGSVLGTIEDAIDTMREEGVAIGALGIKAFRPFPLQEVRDIARQGPARRRRRAGARGRGRRDRLPGRPASRWPARRPGCTRSSPGSAGAPSRPHRCSEMLGKAVSEELEPLHVPGPRRGARAARARSAPAKRAAPGPHAENILRDVGVVAAGPV